MSGQSFTSQHSPLQPSAHLHCPSTQSPCAHGHLHGGGTSQHLPLHPGAQRDFPSSQTLWKHGVSPQPQSHFQSHAAPHIPRGHTQTPARQTAGGAHEGVHEVGGAKRQRPPAHVSHDGPAYPSLQTHLPLTHDPFPEHVGSRHAGGSARRFTTIVEVGLRV